MAPGRGRAPGRGWTPGRGRAAAAATENEEEAAAEQPLGRLEPAEESSGSSDESDDGGSVAGAGGRDQSDMSFEELLRVQSDARMRVSKKVPGGKKTVKPTKATLKHQQGKKG